MNNMEGSGEMNSGDDKSLSDKNKKRTFKTPSQLEALEQFYDEHKYPSEFMKLQLAEKIRLTERQVSSWFCHRRLKDKRLSNGEMYASGRQDRSSGVVQDSCGSTKQGQNKTQDLLEVQSNRFNSQKHSAPGLTLHRGSNHAGNYSYMDDTSSGSSSAPQNLYLKVAHVHMTASKLSADNELNYVNAGKPRSGPSGYLKVKGRLEDPAITAVKMQLGAHYRDDGPPLGTEFDPPPPGAFEPLNQQPENTLNSSETYSAEEHVSGVSPVAQCIHQECISKPFTVEEDNLLPSADGSRVHKQGIPNTGFGCMSNMSLPKTVLDGKNSKMIHKSLQSESFIFNKRKQELSLSEHRSVDMHEDASPDVTIYDKMNKYGSRPMGSAGGSRRGAPAVHHQSQPHRGEFNHEHEESWLENRNGRMPKVEQRDSVNSGYSNLMLRGRKNDAYGDIGLSRKAAKGDSFYGVKSEIDDDVVTVRTKIPRKKEMQMVKDEYPQHVRKV